MKKIDDHHKPAINSPVTLQKEILPPNSPVSEINRTKLNLVRIIIYLLVILIDYAIVEWTHAIFLCFIDCMPCAICHPSIWFITCFEIEIPFNAHQQYIEHHHSVKHFKCDQRITIQKKSNNSIIFRERGFLFFINFCSVFLLLLSDSINLMS